jgi:hypothetical protein
MAISFVGSLVGTHASTSAQTANFSGLLDAAGGTPTLQPNDIVVVTVFQAGIATRTQAQLTPTGYTVAHAAVITASDTNVSSEQTSYKVMGSVPDTSASIPASASTTAGVAYAVHVFRGVDVGTPMDVAATTASGTNSAQPNPPSITPSTAGAWIYCAGGGAMAAGAAPQSTAPIGLSTATNAWRQTVLTTTTNDPGLAAGYKSDWASGAFDCPALTGYTTTNTGSWTAATLALRPQAVTIASGSSTGSATASGAGKSSAKGIGAASGATASAGIGKAQAKGAGSSAGAGVTTGAGKTGLRGNGSIACSSSASGAGKAKATGTGSSSGSCAPSGAGLSRKLAVTSITASGSASGIGAAKGLGNGLASATGAVTGVARTGIVTAGSASGFASASGQGLSRSAANGTTAGSSTAAGQTGSDTPPATGTAGGSASCRGQGRALTIATGAANGSASAPGASLAYATGVGLSAGFGVAVGAGQSISHVPVITPSNRRIADHLADRSIPGLPLQDRSVIGNLQRRRTRR